MADALAHELMDGLIAWATEEVESAIRETARAFEAVREERERFDAAVFGIVPHALPPKATDPVQHTATMTGPYMFPAINPTQSTQQQKAEELKDAEDKVLAAIEHWPKWVRAICYRQLHALGLRMSDVDELIRRRTA